MARYDFGGTLADFVVTSRRLGGLDVLGLSAATLTFWSAQSGGTQYTDLMLNGSAATVIPVGTDGQVPKFQGPDGVTEMWADGGSPRVRVVTLQGAPGPAGKDGLPGVNAVANDTATAGYVNTASSATGKAMTTATARSLGYVIITDQQWAGGADASGVADSTAAIDAACAGTGFRRVWAPPGTYNYNGAGIELKHLIFEGAGMLNTTFVLGAGVTLFGGAAAPSDFQIRNLHILGGARHIAATSTSNAVLYHKIIQNVWFEKYTDVAVLSMMNDNPYWFIDHCYFVAAGDQSGETGIALRRNYDNTHIHNNVFYQNQVHLKLGYNGSTVRVWGNDFLRGNSTATTPRTDVWIVADSATAGLPKINGNKFGNENLMGVDYRVLIADEDTGSGADFGSRKSPSLAQSAVTYTNYATFMDNSLHGATGNKAFITSTVPGTRGLQVTNTVIHTTFPPAMIDVLFPGSIGVNNYNVVGPTICNALTQAYKTNRTIPACSAPGYVTTIDPNGVHGGRPDTMTHRTGAGQNSAATVLDRTAVSSWSLLGSTSRAAITDALGGTNAATLTTTATGDGLNKTVAGMATGVPTWLEFDARLTPGANPVALGSVTASFDNVNTAVGGRTVVLSSTWQTYRIPLVPGALVPDRVKILPGNDLGSTVGQFDIGRIHVYQSPEPVNISGAFLDMVQAPGGVRTKVAAHTGLPTDADVTTARDGVIVATQDNIGIRLAGSWTSLLGSGGGGGSTSLDAVRTTDAAAINNSAALVTDAVLSVTLAANSTYAIDGVIFYDASTVADMKLAFTAPAGASGSWVTDSLLSTTTTTTATINRSRNDFSGVVTAGAAGVGSTVVAKPTGTIRTGASGGTLAVRYAQGTAEATDLIVRADSRLTARKIA